MEKIKQALDKARKESNISRGVISKIDKESREAPQNELTTRITYTKTKSIEISKDELRQKRVIADYPNGPASDQYKVLRTHILQRLKYNHWNSLAVTSPNEGCGKTLTSLNLAISLAREVNHSVLLVDMDLRRPSIHSYFFKGERPGISDYLAGNMELSEILFSPGMERLVILPGNKPFANSSEVLSFPKTVHLVEELKSRYPNRIVIFDMPPLLSCDDVLVFLPYVDSVMVVVAEGSTRKSDLIRANELLKEKNIIGTVLNKSKEDFVNNSYYK